MRQSAPFVALAKAAAARERLDQRLRRMLPTLLRDQVRLADMNGGRLTFTAPSPAWASRLRLAQSEILAAARTAGANAHSLHVKVVLPPPAPVPEPPARAPPSRASARHLQAAARSISDPELRDLFLALASVANVSSPPTETN